MGLYYGIFGILCVLAEIRHISLQRSVLRPFGFLTTWIGRGFFYLAIGALFIELPVDTARVWVTYVPSSFLISMGVLQILVSVFVRKVRAGVRAGGRAAAGFQRGGSGNVAPEGRLLLLFCFAMCV